MEVCMQPLQVNLNSAVTDSCSGCFCCFPVKKDKKTHKEEDKTSAVGSNYFMEKKIDDDYEAQKINVSKASKSETSTF